jgi:hypothetical protein
MRSAEGLVSGPRKTRATCLSSRLSLVMLHLPDAVQHARAVIAVLQEAVSPGEIEDVRSQLPRDFDRLFKAGSEGAMPRQ